MILKDYVGTMMIGENSFTDQNKKWRLATLLKASKNLEVFDLHLMSIDIERYPWGFKDWNFSLFLHHCKRMEELSDDPIILTPNGYICDGWHRLAKAILDGKETIKAVRLEVMPEEDEIITETKK